MPRPIALLAVVLAAARRSTAALTSCHVSLDKPAEVAIEEVLRDGHLALHPCVRADVVDTRYELAFKGDVTKRAARPRGARHPPPTLSLRAPTTGRDREAPPPPLAARA